LLADKAENQERSPMMRMTNLANYPPR